MTPAAAAHPGSLFVSLGLAAAAFWGASDFLGGLATRKANVVRVVAVAHGVSLALLLPIAFATHSAVPSRPLMMLGLAAGAFGGLALILYYQALSLGEMGLTTALTGLLTALIPVAYAWVTQGSPRVSQLGGFGVAGAAIGLIAYTPTGKVRPLALGLASLAGICFGVFLVVLQAGSAPGIVWQLIYSRMASVTLAVLLVAAMRARRPARQIPLSGGWLWIAGGAGVLEATGSLLYMRSAHEGRLDVAAVLASLYPVVTILLAAWILKEKTTARQALGMALALIAVVLVSL
jgi:drug/metabolite transporter (DMT)-like permease